MSMSTASQMRSQIENWREIQNFYAHTDNTLAQSGHSITSIEL